MICNSLVIMQMPACPRGKSPFVCFHSVSAVAGSRNWPNRQTAPTGSGTASQGKQTGAGTCACRVGTHPDTLPPCERKGAANARNRTKATPRWFALAWLNRQIMTGFMDAAVFRALILRRASSLGIRGPWMGAERACRWRRPATERIPPQNAQDCTRTHPPRARSKRVPNQQK